MPTIASERLQARFRFTECSRLGHGPVLTLYPPAGVVVPPLAHDRSACPAVRGAVWGGGARCGQAQWDERTSATMRTIALPTSANACTKPPKMASVVDGDLTVTKMSIATNSQTHQRHLISTMAPPSARRARIEPAMAQYYAIVHSNK